MPMHPVFSSKSPFLALACVLGLGACANAVPPTQPSVWRDDIKSPTQRQINLDVLEQTHILYASDAGLKAGEAARLGAFLAAQGSPWSMDVRVQPLTQRGVAALDQTDRTLIELGVQANRIGRADAGVAPGEGDIAVTARHIRAAVAGCPDWRRANLMDISEQNSSNFGCATADNLARMVADPRELSSGRALAPASGSHAAAAAERYRTDQVKPLIKRDGGGKSGGGGK